jgi:hypothetical protein
MYDAFAVTDNGEGAHGTRDMLARTDSWNTEEEAMAAVGSMSPTEFENMHTTCCYREIAMGNIQVW